LETDKRQLYETIEHLDKKKEEQILGAYERVREDLDRIFSVLLPGTSATLEPLEGCVHFSTG
jgi:chromosome segregation ATPase